MMGRVVKMLIFLWYWELGGVGGYKHVVIIHGIFDHPNSLNSFKDRIQVGHSGTNVTLLDALHGWRSLAPMWYQINVYKQLLLPIMLQNPGGIHLIGYSQGGLLARGLIQSLEYHNVDTFISLSSPQGGQYGDNFLRILFPGYVKSEAWKFFYRRQGQLVSVGNYWRDPHHVEKYLATSLFLPKVDNEVNHKNSQRFKTNFIRLKKVVVIGGPDDGVISPWQSSQFGCYNESENVMEMRARSIYLDDLFGLRTLDEKGALVEVTVPGMGHHNWHQNNSMIDQYILPHLT